VNIKQGMGGRRIDGFDAGEASAYFTPARRYALAAAALLKACGGGRQWRAVALSGVLSLAVANHRVACRWRYRSMSLERW
jgi:hypothetical protein